MGNRFRRVLKLTAEGFFANEVSKRAEIGRAHV